MIDYEEAAEAVVLISTDTISPFATLKSSDVAFGSGFFINPTTIITCAHVTGNKNKLHIVNVSGKVVGLVNAGIPNAQNLGFAIPSIYLKSVVKDFTRLSSRASCTTMNLVDCIILEAHTAQVFGINVNHKVALIKCIKEDLSKHKELRVGDIILEVDGQEPINSSHISSAIVHGKSLKIYREGKIIEV